MLSEKLRTAISFTALLSAAVVAVGAAASNSDFSYNELPAFAEEDEEETEAPTTEDGTDVYYMTLTDTIADLFIVPQADSFGMIGSVYLQNSNIYMIHEDSRSDLYGGIEDFKVGDKVTIEFWCSGSEDGVTADDMLCIRKIISVKLSSTLIGDANCDEQVTIADSTAILQHLGNEDKYGLSDQGKINADCCNIGDGVTGNDAIAIQKMDSKLIDSLPVKE